MSIEAKANEIEIKLNAAEYNGIYQILGGFTGALGALGASKVQQIISDAVRAGVTVGEPVEGQELPHNAPASITILVPKPVANALFEGIKLKANDININTNEFNQLGALAKVFKVSTRFATYVETELSKLAVTPETDDFDVDDSLFDSEVDKA